MNQKHLNAPGIDVYVKSLAIKQSQMKNQRAC